MRSRLSRLSLLIAGAMSLAPGCASMPGADSEVRPVAVQVYEVDPFIGKSYEVVGRLWADSWRSALRVPSYSTKDEAIASMQTEAARLKADALISVSCLDQHGSIGSQSSEPAFVCYGVAIRLRQRQG